MAAGVGVVVGVAGAWVQPATSSMRAMSENRTCRNLHRFHGHSVVLSIIKKCPFKAIILYFWDKLSD